MKEYLDLVKHVLENGVRKENRTGVDTISCFGAFYKIDLARGYPLLTTKKMYFKSMIRELLWYLKGDNHIRDLRQHTKIWDAWADENGDLETAYGRFWRRFPFPQKGLTAERWADDPRWVNTEADGTKTFDQIQYVLDTLKENPNSRRMVVVAWNPANAAQSKLPPCHYSFVFNVINGKLNCHLTQRSADVALGVPFNISCYAALTQILAQQTGLQVGEFAHTLIDAHIYAGRKGHWTEEYGHIEGMKEQLTREPRPLPSLKIANKPIDALEFEDFTLENYDPHPLIKFKVAV
jgi:thymidylate synthase